MGYFDTLNNLTQIRDAENQNALAKRAGGMLARGDQTGARNALWQGGELEAGGRVDAGMSADRKAKAEAMEKFTQGVSRMLDDPSYANDPNGADRAWNDAAQFAPQLGINPETLNQDRDSFLKNPKGWAKFWNEKSKEEQFTLSPGSARYGADGKVIASQPFAPKGPDWRERTRPDGSTEFFDINAEGGVGSPAPRGTPGFNPDAPDPREPAPNADQVVASLTAQGARVTSGVRTPEHNRAVGGQPNSYHLASRGGVARDLVPPQGVSMGQFHAQVKAQLPAGWEAINEGDHVHIEPGPGASRQVAQAGPLTVRGDAPKPGGRGHMATVQEKAALGLSSDAPYWIDENGKPGAVSGEKPNKPLTEFQGKSIELLNAALGGNDRLNDLASRGLYKPRTPTDSLFHNEKDGTKRLILRNEEDRQFVQAAKEWLAPILRKESGAAVTDGELATYMDIYVPKFEDSPQVMWQKAQARDRKMSSIYKANKGAYDATYGAPAKWQVLTHPHTQAGTKPAKPGAKMAGAGWKIVP